MRFLRTLLRRLAPQPHDVASPEERRRIEERNRQVRARVRLLAQEVEVMTARKVDELNREMS